MAAVNESKTIDKVISGIKELGIADKIILVDDASSDGTPELAQKEGCEVIRNRVCIGQTRSLKKGIGAAGTDLVITMDADLDHLPSDIPLLLEAMEKKNCDVVIGCRTRLPRLSETLMSLIVSRTTGITDTISGFRLLSDKALSQVEFDDDDTWGSLFLIRCAKNKLNMAEVEVTTPSSRAVTRTGGRLRSNFRILRALAKDLLCIAGLI